MASMRKKSGRLEHQRESKYPVALFEERNTEEALILWLSYHLHLRYYALATAKYYIDQEKENKDAKLLLLKM